jgi:hypothetical protein
MTTIPFSQNMREVEHPAIARYLRMLRLDREPTNELGAIDMNR